MGVMLHYRAEMWLEELAKLGCAQDFNLRRFYNLLGFCINLINEFWCHSWKFESLSNWIPQAYIHKGIALKVFSELVDI